MNKLLPNIFKSKPKKKFYISKGEEFQYWKRFVESEKASAKNLQVYHKPLVGPKFAGQKPWQWYYGEHDPVSRTGKWLNMHDLRMPLVEPVKNWQYFIGDHVLVMVGSDKGKIGLIQKVIKERNWVFVAGLNRKRDPLNPKGEIKEAPLLYPNEVKLVDPSDMQQTEIEWRYTEEGDQVRVSTRTGRLIPLSAKAAATWEDGVDQNKYSESPQDTSMAALKEVTFTPVNSTFEEDLLRKFDEYEPKKKRKTYWY